jgi:outer membrane immunogenic protein
VLAATRRCLITILFLLVHDDSDWSKSASVRCGYLLVGDVYDSGASMNLRIGIVVVVALIATPAVATDFAVKTAPVAYNWGGCYVGGNVSNEWSQPSLAVPGGFGGALGSIPTNGFAGGVQIGCDREFGPWLLGVRGMFDAGMIQGSGLNPVPPVAIATTDKINWIASATARIGYAVLPDVLLYGQGGIAWRNDTVSLSGLTPPFVSVTVLSGTVTNAGWIVGAGLEWMLLPDVSVFLEYDFASFGSWSSPFSGPAFPVSVPISSASTNMNLVMLGVNYRFHLAGFNRN